jgi:hypothetical protein
MKYFSVLQESASEQLSYATGVISAPISFPEILPLELVTELMYHPVHESIELLMCHGGVFNGVHFSSPTLMSLFKEIYKVS